ncbi:MAG: cation:proton antiporter [Polyangiales bacterium]
MLVFELVVGLLLVGVVLALVADRIELPYPALLAVGGACLALWRGVPELTLDPELALALFVAPVLLDSGFDASPRDIRANLRAVSVLALVVVVLTIAAVAWAAHELVPGMGWAPAVTLGAIVAPPDASAATAVLRRLRPPHRLLVILEAESLFNDASALLVYRLAVGATMTGVFSGWSVVPMLLLTCGGGVLVGVVAARLFTWLSPRVEDLAAAILIQFLGTFGVWILAERLHLSAIVTMVAYAMTLGQLTPGIVGARRRIASYAVWEVAVFVLNVLAFILIGLQLRGIMTRLGASSGSEYYPAVAAVCGMVIGVRLVFWMAYNALVRWRQREPVATVGSGLVIAWCGMRGIVTLATALALPDGEPAGFPHRDFIVFASFCVVLSTLVVQGLTLRPLLLLLRLRDEGAVARELQLARFETARAALVALETHAGEPGAVLLRREYAARVRVDGVGAASVLSLADVQRHAASVQRHRLIELRAQRLIGDDAFHAAEQEIDLLELGADVRVHPEADD